MRQISESYCCADKRSISEDWKWHLSVCVFFKDSSQKRKSTSSLNGCARLAKHIVFLRLTTKNESRTPLLISLRMWIPFNISLPRNHCLDCEFDQAQRKRFRTATKLHLRRFWWIAIGSRTARVQGRQLWVPCSLQNKWGLRPEAITGTFLTKP